jgi:outer membrane protein assembly factor BamD (BamD/ComL family)
MNLITHRKKFCIVSAGFILVFSLLLQSRLAFGETPEVPPPLRDIKTLFAAGQYSLVLEKSLYILNTKGDRLAVTEAAFLHYYIGMAYKKNRNIDLAVEYLKKIESNYPGSEYMGPAWLELADIYNDDYFLKEAYLEKVFEKFPNTPEAAAAGLELSNEYLRLGYFRKALPLLETLVNLWKKGDEKPELYMLLAAAYAGTDDFTGAIGYLRQAEKRTGDAIAGNPFYLFAAGRICYNCLNFDKAVIYLEQLFNVFPDYKDIPAAALLLAQAYEREKKPFIGAVFLVKAIQKNPAEKYLYTLYLHLGRILAALDERELDKIKQNYPLLSDSERLLTLVKNNSMNFEERKTAAIFLSDEYRKNKNIEKSIDNFYQFLAAYRDPRVEKLFRENLEEYLDDLEKNGNYEELLKTWAKLRGRKSFLAPGNLLRFGEILYRLKFYANAEEVYRHLVRYRMYVQHWPEAYKQLARIVFQSGRYRECGEILKKLDAAAFEEPEQSELLYYNAFSLQKLGKEEELKKLLDSRTAPSNGIDNLFQYKILLLKVRQLEKEKEYDEALDLCLKPMDLPVGAEADKVRVTVTITAAGLLYKMKKFREALAYYERAFQSGAASTTAGREWVLFRITVLYRRLEDTSRAEDSLKQLKKLNPASFWVRQLEKN